MLKRTSLIKYQAFEFISFQQGAIVCSKTLTYIGALQIMFFSNVVKIIGTYFKYYFHNGVKL